MSTTPTGLPLFYKSPRALDPTLHAEAGLEPRIEYSFATVTNSVPLGAEELFEAQACYPIVFTASDPVVPVAVLGLDDERNLFVDAEGRWRAGAYIPAYIRRYPFVFISGGTETLTLAVDEAAPRYCRNGGEAFFDGGEPSVLTKKALEFAKAYFDQDRMAREFCAALGAADLLIPYRADVHATDKSVRSLAGFTIVDEQRFRDMPDSLFIEWRGRGWIALVYAHLLSMHRWKYLADMPHESASR